MPSSFLILVLLTGVAFVLRTGLRGPTKAVRPIQDPICSRCRYAVRGLDDPVCPECGLSLDTAGVVDAGDPSNPRRVVVSRAMASVVAVMIVWLVLTMLAVTVWPRYSMESTTITVSPLVTGARSDVAFDRERTGGPHWFTARPDTPPPAAPGTITVRLVMGAGTEVVFDESELREAAIADVSARIAAEFGPDAARSPDRLLAEIAIALAAPDMAFDVGAIDDGRKQLAAGIDGLVDVADMRSRGGDVSYIGGFAGGRGLSSVDRFWPMVAAAIPAILALVPAARRLAADARAMAPVRWDDLDPESRAA